MSYNNSLIRNQLVGQLDLLKSISAGDLSKQEKILLANLPKQIAGIDAGMKAEHAAAEQKVQHEKIAAEHKEKKAAKKAGHRAAAEQSYSLYNDKEISCRDCGEGFVFTARKQETFAEKGLSEPVRCSYCNEYRRQFQHRKLNCTECSSEFDFPIGAQIHYLEQGYDDPVLCHPCRASKKKILPPETINCKDCNKEFQFTYKEQMFYKEQGWQDPRRCVPCRKEHKEEWAKKNAARLAAAAMKSKAPTSSPAAVDLGKFADGADLSMKFGIPSLATPVVDPVALNLIAAASMMVNGDGTWRVAGR